MDAQVVNFSLPTKLLKLADRVAQQEARTRSELFREAIRRYVLRRELTEDMILLALSEARRELQSGKTTKLPKEKTLLDILS